VQTTSSTHPIYIQGLARFFVCRDLPDSEEVIWSNCARVRLAVLNRFVLNRVRKRGRNLFSNKQSRLTLEYGTNFEQSLPELRERRNYSGTNDALQNATTSPHFIYTRIFGGLTAASFDIGEAIDAMPGRLASLVAFDAQIRIMTMPSGGKKAIEKL